MRSGSELRMGQVPSWPRCTLPLQFQGILSLATPPPLGCLLAAVPSDAFHWALTHRGTDVLLPERLVLTQAGDHTRWLGPGRGSSSVRWVPSSPGIQVWRGLQGPCPCTCTVGMGLPAWGDREGPARPGSSYAMQLCFVPSGKCRTPPHLPSPSALHTGAGPWPRGPGQAQPSPFCCTPLCPLSPCPASSRASKIIHWTYSTGPWMTPKAWPLAVPVPGVSTSQGRRRR